MVGRVGDAVDLDGAGSGQPAGAAQQVDALLGQPALLALHHRHPQAALGQRAGGVLAGAPPPITIAS